MPDRSFPNLNTSASAAAGSVRPRRWPRRASPIQGSHPCHPDPTQGALRGRPTGLPHFETLATHRNVNPDLPKIWFPAIRAGSGADVYTLRLSEALNKRGIRTEISWLPLRAEYAPWSVPAPEPPAWANVAHINSWLPALAPLQ